MEMVKVNKKELLTILFKNREEHRDIFLEALDGYHTAALKALQDRVDEAKKNKKVSLRFVLVEPQDQTKLYDRVIKMLEMSVDDEITLSSAAFRNYILDKWHWREQFVTSNAGYSPKAAAMK